jgi:hypothetical protein
MNIKTDSDQISQRTRLKYVYPIGVYVHITVIIQCEN